MVQVEEHFDDCVNLIIGYFKGIVAMCETYTWNGEEWCGNIEERVKRPA